MSTHMRGVGSGLPFAERVANVWEFKDERLWRATLYRDPPASGRRAAWRPGRIIHAWSGAFLGAFGAEFSLAPEEVQIAGADCVLERGTYEITLTPKGGGEPIKDAGKYITVYQRQPDGDWAMARDIWNSSNPLPGMPQ